MLTCFFVKPEAVPLLGLVSRKIEDLLLDPRQREAAEIIRIGLQTLIGGERPGRGEIIYAESGLSLPDLYLSYLYPRQLKSSARQTLKKRLTGNPYGLFIIDSNISPEVFNDVKGKFVAEKAPEGTGLRGLTRRVYEDVGPRLEIPPYQPRKLERGENFFHVADSSEEARRLLKFIVGNISRERIILWKNERRIETILAGWNGEERKG